MAARLGYFYDCQIFPLMFFWTPYQMRCAIFHAETTVSTYCFEKDRNVQVMMFISGIPDMDFVWKDMNI